LESSHIVGRRKHAGRCAAQDRLAKVWTGPDADLALQALCVPMKRRLAADTDPPLAECWEGDYAQNRPPLVRKGHQRAEKGVAGDERLGAVDGIEDPDVIALVALRPVFLADDAML